MQLARGVSLDASLLATMALSCMLGWMPGLPANVGYEARDLVAGWGASGIKSVAARGRNVTVLQMTDTCNEFND